MHLIDVLACGVRGAENGTADIYEHGTTTRASYYDSFEGETSTTPSGAVSLDSNGGGIFYVNKMVLVVVRDSTGTEVRRFVAGTAAPAVEVISQSFTGTDYASSATGVSKPTSLQNILDLWSTNAGAPDFKVDVAGTSTTLQEAFASVGAAFINVKSEAYGAVGNGTTNDTSAIQAALDAAETAGGGIVYFPAGTYRITSAVTVAAGVSIQGAGAGASTISCDHASNHVLTMEADTNFTSISNIRLTHSQATTGRCVNLSGVARLLRIENCVLGNAFANASAGHVYADTTGTAVTIIGCLFIMDTNTGSAVRQAGAVADCTFSVIGCRVKYSGARSSGLTFYFNGLVMGCTIDGSGLTSGSETVFSAGAGSGIVAVVGNMVTNPTGGTLTAWGSGAQGNPWREYANQLGSSVEYGTVTAVAAKSSYTSVMATMRDRSRYYILSNDAAITIPQGKYAVVEVERTNTGAQTVTITNVAGLYGGAGEEFCLVYNNTNHGSATGTITLSGPAGITTFTVNANCFSVFLFKCIHVNATGRWVFIDSVENIA